MRRRLCLQGGAALALAAGARAVAADVSPLPRVGLGRIERLILEDEALGARPVDVWLPPGYRDDRDDRDDHGHAVLYMHDGQMLFDPAMTWNRQAWRIDQVAAPLLAEGVLRNFIVVGLHNHPEQRHAEYFPQACWPVLQHSTTGQRYLREKLGRPPCSDAYLRILVHRLKPLIDGRYATDPRPESCLLMGSSMGGLISLYGLCEYPEVFGGAAALSPHWIGLHQRNDEIPAALRAYLATRLPGPDTHRLYMDRGTLGLDALYDQAQEAVDALLGARGHRPPMTQSLVFAGADHNERDWSARLTHPLRALLAPAAAPAAGGAATKPT